MLFLNSWEEIFLFWYLLIGLLVSIAVGSWLYWRAILRTRFKRRWLLCLTYPLPVAALLAAQLFIVSPWVVANVPFFSEGRIAPTGLALWTFPWFGIFLLPGIVGLLLTRRGRSTGAEERVPVDQMPERDANAESGSSVDGSVADQNSGEPGDPTP